MTIQYVHWMYICTYLCSTSVLFMHHASYHRGVILIIILSKRVRLRQLPFSLACQRLPKFWKCLVLKVKYKSPQKNLIKSRLETSPHHRVLLNWPSRLKLWVGYGFRDWGQRCHWWRGSGCHLAPNNDPTGRGSIDGNGKHAIIVFAMWYGGSAKFVSVLFWSWHVSCDEKCHAK